MRVSFIAAIAMMRRRKLQMSLIAMILVLVSALSYVGLGMLSQKSPVDEMAKRANATETLLMWSGQKAELSAQVKFLEAQPEVKGITQYTGLMSTVELSAKEGQKAESMLCIVTPVQKNANLDVLYTNHNTLAKAPTGNEVQINYNLAKSKNLKVGDVITLIAGNQRIPLTLSALVVDPHFSNPFMSPDRFFVSQDFLTKNHIEADTGLIGIQYHRWTEAEEKKLLEAYHTFVGSDQPPMIINHSSIVNSYNIIFGIIAAILLMISAFILTIVAVVIKSTVGQMILQNYKSIGVRKVLGYTNAQIRNSYLIAYGLLGAVTALLGAGLGLPVRKMINDGVGYDLQVTMPTEVDSTLIITILLICGLMIGFTALSVRSANRIKPVQAIKYGMPEYKISRNRFRISHYVKVPVMTLLAIKQLLMHKRKSLTTVFLLTLIMYSALIIHNTGETLADEHHFLKYLTGTRVGDYAISDSSVKSVKESLDLLVADEQTQSALFVMMAVGQSIPSKNGDDIVTGGQLFYGKAPEDLIQLTKGRSPRSGNEIVLSEMAANEAGKVIGDYVDIMSGERSESYLITGLFNTVTYSARGYVRIIETIPETLTQERGYYWVFTNTKPVIIKDIQDRLSQVMSKNVLVTAYDTNMANVLSTLAPFGITVKTLLFIFLMVCGVIVLNWTLMDINSMTRVYGVFRALGFTLGNIKSILLQRAFMVAGLGILTGLLLNVLTANAVMKSIFSLTPFNSIHLPVRFDLEGSLLIAGLFLIVTAMATLLGSRRLKTIQPKQLISE